MMVVNKAFVFLSHRITAVTPLSSFHEDMCGIVDFLVVLHAIRSVFFKVKRVSETFSCLRNVEWFAMEHPV